MAGERPNGQREELRRGLAEGQGIRLLEERVQAREPWQRRGRRAEHRRLESESRLAAGGGGEFGEVIGVDVKGQATIAVAVIVAAFKGGAHVAEQQGAGVEEGSPPLATIAKAPFHDR